MYQHEPHNLKEHPLTLVLTLNYLKSGLMLLLILLSVSNHTLSLIQTESFFGSLRAMHDGVRHMYEMGKHITQAELFCLIKSMCVCVCE